MSKMILYFLILILLLPSCSGNKVSREKTEETKTSMEISKEKDLQNDLEIFNLFSQLVQDGNKKQIEELTSSQYDLNTIYGEMEDLLSIAIAAEQIEIIEYLLEKGYSKSQDDGINRSFLQLLSKEATRNLVELFLNSGYSPSAEDLFYGVSGGQIDEDLLDFLINENVLNSPEKLNHSLTGACEKGDLNFVKKLIESGADNETEISIQHEGFYSPLASAIANGHLAIVSYFIEQTRIPFHSPLQYAYQSPQSPIDLALTYSQQTIAGYLLKQNFLNPVSPPGGFFTLESEKIPGDWPETFYLKPINEKSDKEENCAIYFINRKKTPEIITRAMIRLNNKEKSLTGQIYNVEPGFFQFKMVEDSRGFTGTLAAGDGQGAPDMIKASLIYRPAL